MAARYSSGPRLFLSDVRLCYSTPVPFTIDLNQNESHYLRDVLRLAQGSRLEVGDPTSGTVGLATIESIADRVRISITAWIQDASPPQRPIIILCALCKGDKNELICDWSTELGCSEIHFWQSPRSVVRLKKPEDFEHRAARFAKVVTAAAQQSRQSKPPSVAVHESLEAAITALVGTSTMNRYLCSLEPSSRPLAEVCAESSLAPPTLVIIGPEGDITPQEQELLLQRAHATPVTLGPSVLRSELAVVSAITTIRAVDLILTRKVPSLTKTN